MSRGKMALVAGALVATIAAVVIVGGLRVERRYRENIERYRARIEKRDYVKTRYLIEEEIGGVKTSISPMKQRYLRSLEDLRARCLVKIREEGIDEKKYFTDELFRGIEAGDISLVRDSLKHDVDINARNALGKTPLIAACNKGSFGIVRLIVENGADMNLNDFEGRPALSQVAPVDDMARIMHYLIQHGAKVED